MDKPKAIITILLSLFYLSLFSQNTNPNLSWGEAKERTQAAFEFVTLENDQRAIVFYGEKEIIIQKLIGNKIARDQLKFEIEEIRKQSEREQVDIVHVNNYIYFFSKSFDKKSRKFNAYMWRINLIELELDIVKKKMFEMEFLENGRATEFLVCASEDKTKFFFGYHNLEKNAKSEKDFIFNFKGTAYDNEGSVLWEKNHVFKEPVEYFHRTRSNITLTNSGNLIFKHYLGNKIIFASKKTDGFVELGLLDELKSEFPKALNLNNIKVLNSKFKSIACFTVSEHKDGRFIDGFAFVEFDNDGGYEIKNQFAPPKNLVDNLVNTKYKEASDCIRERGKNNFVMFSWKLFDFEEVDGMLFLVTEYNQNSLSGGPWGISNVYRIGDIVIYRFDEDLQEAEMFHIPKLFFGGCGREHCEFLMSKGSPKGYSMVKTGSELQLFYWNNTNNEVFTSGTLPEKRVVHHVPTAYRKEIGLYKTTIGAGDRELNVKRLGVYEYMDFPVMPNVNGVCEGNIYFNSLGDKKNAIVSYPVD